MRRASASLKKGRAICYLGLSARVVYGNRIDVVVVAEDIETLRTKFRAMTGVEMEDEKVQKVAIFDQAELDISPFQIR